MRRAGHAVFAATLIAIGLLGLIRGTSTPLWLNAPKGAPARGALLWIALIVPLACGIGLLWRRTAAVASRVLLGFFLAWVVLLDLPELVLHFGTGTIWPIAEHATLVVAAWLLYTWLGTPSDPQRVGFATGATALRIARAIFGLALLWFGAGHFTYLQRTVSLVPGWLPWHLFWACFFGCTFFAAGGALIIGLYARLAAALMVVQLGVFTVLVWVPIVAFGNPKASDWTEFVMSWALTAAAWIVADSYHGTPWLTPRIAAQARTS